MLIINKAENNEDLENDFETDYQHLNWALRQMSYLGNICMLSPKQININR